MLERDPELLEYLEGYRHGGSMESRTGSYGPMEARFKAVVARGDAGTVRKVNSRY